MTKQNYIDQLIAIGYSPEEAKSLVGGTKWSMVQLEDTSRCNRMLYDLEGKRIDGDTSFRVKTPSHFSDLNSYTLAGAKELLKDFGNVKEDSEHKAYWDDMKSHCYIVKVIEKEERI